MPGVGAGVGHVHFMFFVLISFVFCSQRKPSFRWNMGLRVPKFYLVFPVDTNYNLFINFYTFFCYEFLNHAQKTRN